MISLSEKQKIAFNSMQAGKNILITGPAGAGKSILILKFYDSVKKFENIVITSMTGISALLIGGVTLHSYLGIGTGRSDVSTLLSLIRKKTPIKNRWLNLKILIIDEISMLSAELFEKLDIIAKKLRKNEKPFGGIQLILSGDFCQLPIIKADKFCFESDLWDLYIEETIYLDKIFRQNDNKFQKCLNEIRIGVCSLESIELLDSRLNYKFDNKLGIQPTLLYAKKYDVDKVNKTELQKLIDNNADHKEYMSSYNINIKDKKNMAKYKEIIDKNCQCETNLILAIGAQVMIITNINGTSIVNGSRGIVSRFDNNIPVITLLDGSEISLEKYTWEYQISDTITITKKQYPIKLAYALTIHKSQGMTIDYIETDIGNSIFEYGQTYVVLSRVKNIEGLSIKKLDISKIKIHPKVKIYYENLKNMEKIINTKNRNNTNKSILDYYS